MDTESIKLRIKVLYLTLSFARPKAQREPMMRDRIVVDDATIVLLKIIFVNGCPLKIEI
jgi:hypothetical protein